jgi:hypothetical protein
MFRLKECSIILALILRLPPLLLLVREAAPLAVEVTALEEQEREGGDGDAEEGAEHEGVLCPESGKHLRGEEGEDWGLTTRGGRRRRKGKREVSSQRR